MLHDLLRPRAVIRHLLVLAVTVTCVSLGLWQLDRLDQVRASNALLEARMAAPVAELDALLETHGDVSELVFRRVRATGEFVAAEEVLQRNRTHRGQTGFHLLTPLALDDDTTLLVRRGWVPSELDTPPVTQAAPPDGRVTVTGILEASVDQPGFGPRDPDDGVLERVFHPDTARLDGQVTGMLLPVVLRLDASEVAGELPLALDPPTLDEANHRSYAVQWFTFAALALGTYGAWLYSRRRRSGPGSASGAPG